MKRFNPFLIDIFGKIVAFSAISFVADVIRYFRILDINSISERGSVTSSISPAVKCSSFHILGNGNVSNLGNGKGEHPHARLRDVTLTARPRLLNRPGC